MAEWKVLKVWKNEGMANREAEVTAEKDGKTVYVTAGMISEGYYYMVTGKSLFSSGYTPDDDIAEYPSQKAALSSEYGPLFRKAIAAYRKI